MMPYHTKDLYTTTTILNMHKYIFRWLNLILTQFETNLTEDMNVKTFMLYNDNCKNKALQEFSYVWEISWSENFSTTPVIS